MQPKTEWPRDRGRDDRTDQGADRLRHSAGAIGPVASLIGSQLFGISALGITIRPSLTARLTTAVVSFVLAIVGLFVVAFVANFLSPKFGGKDRLSGGFQAGRLFDDRQPGWSAIVRADPGARDSSACSGSTASTCSISAPRR